MWSQVPGEAAAHLCSSAPRPFQDHLCPKLVSGPPSGVMGADVISSITGLYGGNFKTCL